MRYSSFSDSAESVFLLLLLTVFACGCGSDRQLVGVVQTVDRTDNRVRLNLGVSPESAYVLVDPRELIDLKARALMRDPDSRRVAGSLLGTDFVARRIRVTGQVQRDSVRRPFILVNKREQIEILE